MLQYSTLKETELIQYLTSIEADPSLIAVEEKPELIERLLDDIDIKRWSEELVSKALSVLKVLGRDPSGSDPLFTKKGMSVLVQRGGLSRDQTIKDSLSSREALKCIANSIFLKEHVKVYLEEEGIMNSSLYVLQHGDHLSDDTQFLLCRILFFMSVNRSDLVTQLIDSNIASTINKILMQNIHVLETSHITYSNTPITPSTIIDEALKLLFNIMLVDSRNTSKENENEKRMSADGFKDCLTPIFHILVKIPYAKPQPIVPPHSHAIHALMQYPYAIVAKTWYPEHDPKLVVAKLIQALYCAIQYLIPTEDTDKVTAPNQIDAVLSPPILVLRTFAEDNIQLRTMIADAMLPHEEDRFKPVHIGHSLPAYLIRFMTSAMLPQTRDAVCETLFVLCDKNATEFTEKVGYGNGIGYLVNKGIAVDPPNQNTEDETDMNINPITGQYLSAEKGPSLADMTDEEKEREAERLFVLFERLKKTGIIDVENPIAKAMQEGGSRFEEIETTSDSD